MRPIRALILCFAGLLCGLTAAAQTPDTIREPDSLHQFNYSVRKLVKQVTPSVVQVQASGYAPVENLDAAA